MVELSEQQIIDDLARRLVDSHDTVDPSRVEGLVREHYARFDGRPIRDFVPLFVERSARADLESLLGFGHADRLA